MCIHIGNICDHQKDCPSGDDELFCELINVKCPHKCTCILFAITCNNIYFKQSFDISFHVSVAVFIFNSTIPSSYFVSQQFESIQILKLAKHNIQQACFLQLLTKLIHFDLAFNLVEVIHRHCFSSSLLLLSLDLHKNRISHLERESFYNLSKLRFLNIASNPITIISGHSFRNLLFLTVFNFSAVPFKKIGQNVFDNTRLGLIIINTNYFISCISPPTSICTLYPPWYVSCSGILPTKYLKLIFPIIPLLVGILNIISLLNHVNSWSNRSFLIIMVAVNMNDFLCCIYLSIIWISDLILHKTLYMSDVWKSHFLCFTAFGIIFWFSILSPTVLAFMSFARLMIVVYPF